jgi:hypothetical protein
MMIMCPLQDNSTSPASWTQTSWEDVYHLFSLLFIFSGKTLVRQKHKTRAHAKKQQESSTHPTAVCVAFSFLAGQQKGSNWGESL